MSQPIFIEILARNGEVLQRHRFNQTPIRIGRAYDNDLLLDDPHVAAHHATLEEVHGELVMRAAETHNGLVSGGRRKNLLDLDGNTQVRLGHTRLRVRRADHPVAAEIPDSTNHHWEGLLPAFIGVGLMVAVALAVQWLNSTIATETLGLFTEAAGMLLILLVWAGLWALANRLFAGSARLGRHLFITACGYLLDEAWINISSIVAYAFSWEFLDRYSDLFSLLPIALAVYFHLTTVYPRLPRRMAFITLAITFATNAMILISTYNQNGSLANQLYMSSLSHPSLRKTADLPLSTFFENAAQLREQIDKVRGEAVKKEEKKLATEK